MPPCVQGALMGIRLDEVSGTDRPVLKDKGGNAPNGPVGRDVILAGRREMVDRPDPVGPHSRTEQSVFLRLDVDQVEHVPAHIVHPGVEMCRARIEDAARWAPMGGMHMTKTGRWLVGRWAGGPVP